MEVNCAIVELFNAIKTSHEEKAKTLLGKAKEEVDLVSKVECINKHGKESLQSISEIIAHVSNGNMKEARNNYNKAESQFSGHVKHYLMKKLKEVNEVKELPTESFKQKRNSDEITNIRSNRDNKEENNRPNNTGENQVPHDNANRQHVNDKVKSQHPNDNAKGQSPDDYAKNHHTENNAKSQHPTDRSHLPRDDMIRPLQDETDKCEFTDEKSNAKFIPKTSSLHTNKPLMENNGGSNVEEQGPDDAVNFRRPQHKDLKRTDVTAEEKRSSKTNNEFQVIEKSKRASQAMRQNNPEIADLSDPYRPTKIAERFSELYDNEWTEAFEELSRKSRTEKEIISYLLYIINRAYKFCNDKAESEINLIVKAFNRILEFGPQDFNNESAIPQFNTRSKEGKGIMIQYRKEIADKAIPRLKEEFKSSILQEGNKRMNLPIHIKSVDRFAENAVELTWWMCVQDPPVHLCPTDDSGKESFDVNLYKAYTKTGSKPDFFVWPALRLYKDGGVLLKGVVQYL